MDKAAGVFNKLAGIGSLWSATKELPFNLKASKIYTGEMIRDSRELLKLKRKKYWESINDVDEIEKIIRNSSKGSLEEQIKNLTANVTRYKALRKPHIKKVKEGLIIPAATASATGVTGAGIYYEAKKEISKKAEVVFEKLAAKQIEPTKSDSKKMKAWNIKADKIFWENAAKKKISSARLKATYKEHKKINDTYSKPEYASYFKKLREESKLGIKAQIKLEKGRGYSWLPNQPFD